MKRRFTIRGLLALTLLASLVMAFPYRTARLQEKGREWVAEQRGHVTFRHEEDYKTGEFSIPGVPSFMVNLLGVDLFNPVVTVVLDCETVEDIKPISQLRSLEAFVINIDMSEELDFAPLKSLPSLREVYFTQWSGVSRDQLDSISAMLPHAKIHSESHLSY